MPEIQGRAFRRLEQLSADVVLMIRSTASEKERAGLLGVHSHVDGLIRRLGIRRKQDLIALLDRDIQEHRENYEADRSWLEEVEVRSLDFSNRKAFMAAWIARPKIILGEKGEIEHLERLRDLIAHHLHD